MSFMEPSLTVGLTPRSLHRNRGEVSSQTFQKLSSLFSAEPILNRAGPIVMKQVGIECHQQLVFALDRELHLLKTRIIERNIDRRIRVLQREQPSLSQSDRTTEGHLSPRESFSGRAKIAISDRTADAFVKQDDTFRFDRRAPLRRHSADTK